MNFDKLRDEALWYEEFKKFSAQWDNLRPVFAEEYCAGFQKAVELYEKELSKYKQVVEVLMKAMIKLSQSGCGSSADKRASFYDCLPTLQIEFTERKDFARQAIESAKAILGEK